MTMMMMMMLLQTYGNLFQSEGATAALPKPVFHQVISVALYFHRPLQPIHNSCPIRAQMVIESATSANIKTRTQMNARMEEREEKTQREMHERVSKKTQRLKLELSHVRVWILFLRLLFTALFVVGFGRLLHLVVFTTIRCDYIQQQTKYRGDLLLCVDDVRNLPVNLDVPQYKLRFLRRWFVWKLQR